MRLNALISSSPLIQENILIFTMYLKKLIQELDSWGIINVLSIYRLSSSKITASDSGMRIHTIKKKPSQQRIFNSSHITLYSKTFRLSQHIGLQPWKLSFSYVHSHTCKDSAMAVSTSSWCPSRSKTDLVSASQVSTSAMSVPTSLATCSCPADSSFSSSCLSPPYNIKNCH